MQRLRLLVYALLATIAVACNAEGPDVPNAPTHIDYPEIPNNEIWYTTSNKETITPSWAPSLEHAIVSNTYADGKGVMCFDGDITEIGSMLFSNSYRLTSITLPLSVKHIGKEAFDNCTKLKTITISPYVESIGKRAFYGCPITEFTLPAGVTTLEVAVFGACQKLEKVTLSEGLTKISKNAFTSCTALKSLNIPKSVEEIEAGAFAGCRSLAQFSGKYASEDGRCLIKDNALIAFAPNGIRSYTIPKGVTTIGESAFALCENIEFVDIPTSVTRIEAMAFSYCYALETITIPENVEYLGARCCFTSRNPQSVYCMPTTPPTADKGTESSWLAFSSAPYPELTIYVPKGSVEAYKTSAEWEQFAKNIVGYEF